MVDIVTELGRYAKSLDKSNFVKERRHRADKRRRPRPL
jgi:hypothetical protein